MHELGILRQIVKIVEQTAVKNGIEHIRNITLEIGRDSEVVSAIQEQTEWTGNLQLARAERRIHEQKEMAFGAQTLSYVREILRMDERGRLEGSSV